MPYRRMYRRRPVRRARRTRRSTVARAPFRSRVRSVIQSFAERKFNSFVYNANEIDWDGRMHTYNDIAQGDSITTRTGNQIQPVGISYSFSIYSLAQNNTNTVTLIWFRDRQQVGDTNPTPSQLLTSSAVGTGAAPNALLNTNNLGRFKVLKRLTFRVEDRDSGTASRVISGWLPLKRANKPIRYNGTGTGDIERNGLYLLFITSGDPIADSLYVTGETRMWYTDV